MSLLQNSLMAKLDDLRLFIHDWPGYSKSDLYRKLPYQPEEVDLALSKLIEVGKISYETRMRSENSRAPQPTVIYFCTSEMCRIFK